VSHSATDRYRLRAAPAGLALVQDFLNTRSIQSYGADLLADRDDAQAWAAQALEQWARDRGTDAPRIALSTTELRALRTLRSAFESMIGAPGDGDPPAPVGATLIPGDDGVVRLTPTGRGWKWLASALWIETFRAQQDGTWPRLKVCRNTECGSAFYDGSRNNSGVWHDVRTCGNVANLRASRQRKRAQRMGA
jgi:hypothetical protein